MAKSKNTKYNQSTVFEFKPSTNITKAEIMELAELIRIGIGGEVLDKASPSLKKHFIEVEGKAVELKEAA
jgi:hypothetical protein